jgi:type 1 glutamine amidotransferase
MSSKRNAILALCSLVLGLGSTVAQTNVQTKVLVLNKSGGYAHTDAIVALADLLKNNAVPWNLAVTVQEDATNFTLPFLRGFNVVVFNNNTSLGSVVTGAGQAAFTQWMQEGGGVLGMHGAMDHSDTWKWYTDNMALSKFSGHSGYCDAPNSQVQVDDVATNGVVRAQKPEYASLLAVLPKTKWTWCDEWYAFTSNPRNLVDMLITIDEKTFTPSNVMGDHPVTWTLKMPVGPTGKQGKYFYSSRGHAKQTFDDVNTKNMVHFGVCWSAGYAFTATSCQSVATSIGGKPFVQTSMDARAVDGSLLIKVTGSGEHRAEVYGMDGRKVAQEKAIGNKDFSFANLAKSKVYLVKVKSGKQILTQRIVL